MELPSNYLLLPWLVLLGLSGGTIVVLFAFRLLMFAIVYSQLLGRTTPLMAWQEDPPADPASSMVLADPPRDDNPFAAPAAPLGPESSIAGHLEALGPGGFEGAVLLQGTGGPTRTTVALSNDRTMLAEVVQLGTFSSLDHASLYSRLDDGTYVNTASGIGSPDPSGLIRLQTLHRADFFTLLDHHRARLDDHDGRVVPFEGPTAREAHARLYAEVQDRWLGDGLQRLEPSGTHRRYTSRGALRFAYLMTIRPTVGLGLVPLKKARRPDLAYSREIWKRPDNSPLDLR